MKRYMQEGKRLAGEDVVQPQEVNPTTARLPLDTSALRGLPPGKYVVMIDSDGRGGFRIVRPLGDE